jgi:hypothetical protein
MAEISHPIALAHAQGLQAGKFAEATPLDCPWPIHEYDACLAWFSGFAIGALAKSSNALGTDISLTRPIALLPDSSQR